MTLNEIRQQLKTIRLYYTSKARFSAAFDTLPHSVTELAATYAATINSAPLDLYLVYYELYVLGLTQEAAAVDLNYSTEYIRQKNKRLLLFLQNKFNGEASWLEEIKIKNNTLGLKVYTIGEPQTSGEEYELLVSSFLDGLEKLAERENGQEKPARWMIYLFQRQAHASLSQGNVKRM